MPYRLLLTGFDAFGALPDNPSHRIAHALAAEALPGLEITPLTVPTQYEAGAQVLRDAVAAAAYDGVVMLGLAQNAPVVRLESTALNIADASLADNAGDKREGTPLAKSGPNAIVTDLPLDRVCQALHAKGLPVKRSHSAGTFVCNALYYAALTLPSESRPRDVLFIHIPATECLIPARGAWPGPITREAFVQEIVREAVCLLPTLRNENAEPS